MPTSTLEELVIKLGVDSDEVDSGMDKTVRSAEKGLGKLSTVATTAGVAAAAALGSAFTDALDLEGANDKLAAQLDLSAAEAQRVGDISGELYRDAYGESINEVNEALRGVIAQTGELGDVTDAELSGMGAAALDLAAILETDVARVTQVAGQVAREGLAGNMTEAFDLITAASQKTMPGLAEDVLDTADEYATFFGALGFDGERAFGLLAAASQGGAIAIDKTADAIKEFTILSTDMSTSSVEAFDAIGLDAETMSNRILAGGDTAAAAFDKIVTGLLAIENPTERATAAIALFGTPLEDLGTSEIPVFLESLIDAESGLGDVSGAATDAGATLNDNAAAGFTALARSAQQGLAASLEPLLPILSQFLAFVTPMAPILGPVAIAIVAIAAAQWLWNAALAASPITLIILAIVALIAIIAVIVHNLAWFRGIWDTVWRFVSDVITVVVNWFRDRWNDVWGWFTGLISSIGGFFSRVWNGAVAVIGGVIDWFRDTWRGAINAVRGFFGGLASFATGIWDSIVGGVKSAINAVIRVINGAIGGVNAVTGVVGIPAIPNIPLLAAGGNIRTGGAAVVGDAGPEILDLPRGARVTPLDRARTGGGGGGGALLGVVGDIDSAFATYLNKIIRDGNLVLVN